ncbi:hypothetical protein SAMN05421827_108186 [Pedobacter terrae]|uniref:O-Methyltransferase involved in polyketide biosynthesis n=1 Tax=Pedobacter terrae TaxID=405671 RepID=A0A1G7VPQ0_9SPHI|nr:hypothetical protein [Pedobacter terrae]SDG61775.1 hypothetical protein SAMN05421827_108186 [Pedobacter terrae]
MNRDYNSISPSAKSLMLAKSLTDIPFVADAVKLIYGNDAIEHLLNRDFDEVFLKRLVHFESRYLSLDSLLFASGSLNILEISSGYSFRGLDLVLRHPTIYYLDTDLQGIIDIKKDLVERLIVNEKLNLKGKLKTEALNALNEDAFLNAVNQMPLGPISIINEGLLVYLNTDEKTSLCKTIHKSLKQRGGYWITADVYVKRLKLQNDTGDHFSQFLEAHHVEDNKFESFEQAEHFFLEQGFKLVTKATSVWHQLSSLKYIDIELLKKMKEQANKIGRIRETWVLKAI